MRPGERPPRLKRALSAVTEPVQSSAAHSPQPLSPFAGSLSGARPSGLLGSQYKPPTGRAVMGQPGAQGWTEPGVACSSPGSRSEAGGHPQNHASQVKVKVGHGVCPGPAHSSHSLGSGAAGRKGCSPHPDIPLAPAGPAAGPRSRLPRQPLLPSEQTSQAPSQPSGKGPHNAAHTDPTGPSPRGAFSGLLGGPSTLGESQCFPALATPCKHLLHPLLAS